MKSASAVVVAGALIAVAIASSQNNSARASSDASAVAVRKLCMAQVHISAKNLPSDSEANLILNNCFGDLRLR